MKKRRLKNPVQWANEYIKEWNENNKFDPIDFLEQKKRDVKIYCLCVDFLENMEKLKSFKILWHYLKR